MEKLLESQVMITGLSFDVKGSIYFCSPQNGDVNMIDNETANIFVNSKGSPNSVCFDSKGNMFICDLAYHSLLMVGEDKEATIVEKEYDGKMFKGPNTIITATSGTMYFTDSGLIGETTIQNPRGSVFAIRNDQLLQPVALECLAHPCGLALSPKEDILYVAETMKNRILRFTQRPTNVYQCTVFYQFSGGFGPTAMACDNKGNIYVARFEYNEFCPAEREGMGFIEILSPMGKMIGEIKVPGPEITSICFDSDYEYLYVTEGSTKALYRFKC